VDDRELLRQLALGRVAAGAASVVAPGFALKSFLGATATEGGARVITRSFGIRDALLGLGTLQALDRDEHVKEWVVAGLVADATDLAATLLAARSMPKTRVVLMVAMAGGATAIGALLASRWG
jgi:hypothetical protein